MIFRRNKKNDPPRVYDPELIAAREKMLLTLEADLHVMGWDQPCKYYQVLDFENEPVVVMRDIVPTAPVSYLVGRTLALGIERGVVGCAFTFEGWTLPDDMDPASLTCPLSEHPRRRETRILAAEFSDGMSVVVEHFRDTDEVRVINSATEHEKLDHPRGPLVEALQHSIGLTEEPTDEMRHVMKLEMEEFMRMQADNFNDQRLSSFYEELQKLIKQNADSTTIEACIRTHAPGLNMSEDELIAIARMTGLI